MDKLDEPSKARLYKAWEVINKAKIKKINATLMRGIPENKGNVSAYLKGKRPMSDNFYNTLIEKYSVKDEEINIPVADVGKEVSRLIGLTINQQAKLNLILKVLNISDAEIDQEINNLYTEYTKTHKQ